MSAEVKKKIESDDKPPRSDLEYLSEALNAFFRDFGEEGDRACVILGAARLDLGLRRLLEKFLRPNSSSTDELFDPERPLSSFHGKIEMAYRLKLITADLARAIHLVRKIRNSFAHEVSGAKLNEGSYRNRVFELVGPLISDKIFLRIVPYFEKYPPGPSRDFRCVLFHLVLSLDLACQNVCEVENKENRLTFGKKHKSD